MFMFFIFLFINNFLYIISAVDFLPLSNISRNKRAVNTIIDEEVCSEVKSICNNLGERDDLLILECLLATNPTRLQGLTTSCQHVIWDHARKIIADENVKDLLKVCDSEFQDLNCRNEGGNYLKCALSNIKEIKNKDCSQLLFRLENVAFADYKWMTNFFEHCSDDINTTKCGRFDPNNFSQQNTINCLQDNMLTLKDVCKREIFLLAEIQSNNIKLDAPLYIDCASDHSRYCSQFTPGGGRVIPCLMKQLHFDPATIDPKCRQQLFRRQRLIAQDFRVSKGLIKACKDDIKKTHCRKQTSTDKTVRLAQILLCLENVMKNGTKIDSECEGEIIEHRKMLMEDYRLSPEIVNDCKNETQLYCKGFAYGGKTIHCLMQQALKQGKNDVQNDYRVSQRCLRALEDLVKQTDAGENWSVDPVLHQACDPVVKAVCKNIPSGNARIISCLMDNRNSDAMTEECENALIEIQYFVARDFKLDPQLYKACKQDAIKLCHFFDGINEIEGPSYGHEILPCLYRHTYSTTDDLKVQQVCVQQIHRIMRQRALSVDLHPEIEEVCVRDLGAFCHDKLHRGEEMQCLQDNLDDLEDKCHNVVESFTEIEAQHIDLNPYIARYCGKELINKICNEDISDDQGDIMDCLIENKNNPIIKANQPCRASIEHFQLITLRDIKFTYKFKMACKPFAMRLCQNRAANKNEVIGCLSENILNATVQGLKNPISKDCRQQLKAQIFQQREKIDFDPILKKACDLDIKKFCKDVPMENAQVLECLQTQSKKYLSPKCGKEIFKIQRLEAYDNSVDYALQTMCAEAIDIFCTHHDKETIFDCLKASKDERGFNKRCRQIVMHRVIEQNSNNLLNPTLQKNCQLDVKKFCKNELMTADEKSIGDSVVACLKTQFKVGKLTHKCENEIANIMRERTLNIDLNPVIQVECQKELETICKFDDEDSGKVEECLKMSFINKNIASDQCKQEIAKMIVESKLDIHADPILEEACHWDLLTYCNHVERGNSRHIMCLKNVLEGSTQNLSPDCKTKLKERMEMYQAAPKAYPADLQQLVSQVTSSPAKNFFVIVLFMMVGTIFFSGVFIGRVSKKKYRLLKNK